MIEPLYRRFFLYADSTRQSYRYISEPEETTFDVDLTYGKRLELQFPGDKEPSTYVIAHLPVMRRTPQFEGDKVPVMEYRLAPAEEWVLYKYFEWDGREIQ